jgi:hypothetical protein
MPTLSIFYGSVIRMYFADHAPPRFHALYSEHQAQIDIASLRIIKGALPRQAKALVLKWARLHQNELFEAWDACCKTTQPKPIEPLE